MSVTLQEEAGGKVLVAPLSGKLMKEDYERFVPEVERLISARQDPHAGPDEAIPRLDDGRPVGGHQVRPEALQRHRAPGDGGDRKWEAGMAAFCKPFTRATIRYFDEAKYDEAVKWIMEGAPQPAAG